MSNSKTVYVIKFLNINQLFNKINIDVNLESAELSSINNMLLNQFNNTSSSYNNYNLYKIEDGYEKLCATSDSELINKMHFFDPRTIQSNDVLTIRPLSGIINAMTSYAEKTASEADDKIKYIYSKMTSVDLPYFIPISPNGACFYYSYLYGLFMDPLMNSDSIDGKNKITQYCEILKNGLTEFKKENASINWKQYKFEDEDINKVEPMLEQFKNWLLKMNDSPSIKRLYFENMISCFPKDFMLLVLALKCTGIHSLNQIINWTDLNKNYQWEFDKIMQKYGWVNSLLPQHLNTIFGNNDPTVVQTKNLLTWSDKDIDTYFDIVSKKIVSSNAHVAYTGGHYDVALKSVYTYNIDEIKQHIDVLTNASSNSDSSNSASSESTIFNISEEEQKKQQEFIQNEQEEINKTIEESAKKEVTALTDADLNIFMSEPGINYLTEQPGFFTNSKKPTELRTKLRNYFIQTGSYEFIDLLNAKYFEKTDSAKELPSNLYGDLPTLPNDASISAKKAYIKAADPVKFAAVESAQPPPDWNKIYVDIITPASSTSSASTSSASTSANANASTASTAATTTNANATTASTATAATAAATKPSFNAWAQLNADGTVKDVVFNKPLNSVKLDDWKKTKPTVDQFIELTFELDNDGLSTNLTYDNLSTAAPADLDEHLAKINP